MMTRIERFVGIDVSGTRLDVYCHPDGECFAIPNTEDGIARLLTRLGADGWVAACEATGGHEARLIVAMSDAGHDIWCLHPADVRGFARLVGRRAKTDPIDACAIARALAAAQGSRNPLRMTKLQHELKQLTMLRRHLLSVLSDLKSLASVVTSADAKVLIEARLKQAEADLAATWKTIIRTIAKDDQTKAKADLIVSVPGAGKVLATEILAAMPELGTISAKQAASLVGVAPHPRQSGASRRNGRCQGGRANLRRILYMAALSAIKVRAPSLYPFYERLRQNGKPFKVAIVAAMRKLITQINAVLRHNRPFTAEMPT